MYTSRPFWEAFTCQRANVYNNINGKLEDRGTYFVRYDMISSLMRVNNCCVISLLTRNGTSLELYHGYISSAFCFLLKLKVFFPQGCLSHSAVKECMKYSRHKPSTTRYHQAHRPVRTRLRGREKQVAMPDFSQDQPKLNDVALNKYRRSLSRNRSFLSHYPCTTSKIL